MPSTRCLKADGTPKHAYRTHDEAFAEAAKHHGAYRVYACAEHGFHIGGKVSRALRQAVYNARKRRNA